MTDEATLTGAEFEETNAAPDPDESLINAINGTEPDENEDSDDLLHDPDAEKPDKPLVDTFKVKINGQEKDVTRDELIAHYQKNEAAQQKFEQAAEIRREAEAQRETYLQHQQLMAQAIQQIQTQAQQWAQEGQPDWQDLLDNNPHEYLRQKEIFAKRQQTLQQAQAAQSYLQQQQQTQHVEQMQKHLAAEGQKLITEYLPEWQDKTVRQRDEAELISFLKEKGYNDDDLNNLNQSRASNIVLALNAMKYEKLLAKAKAAKKVPAPETATPVPTVGGKAGSVKDPTQMSDAEFAKWRKSQGARR